LKKLKKKTISKKLNFHKFWWGGRSFLVIIIEKFNLKKIYFYTKTYEIGGSLNSKNQKEKI